MEANNEIRPVLFSGEHLTRAMKDDAFYAQLPQFLPIKAKIAAMHVDFKYPRGCSPCQQRRVRVNIERDFAAIVSSLDADAGKIFKSYFGCPRMVIHAVDPKTHAAYLKEI